VRLCALRTRRQCFVFPILSDCAAPEDHQRAAQAGFDRHFDKPPDIERLQKILDELQVG